MIYGIFNLSSILGASAFIAIIVAIAAYEGGMYITSVVLVAIFAGCTCLSIKEDGQRK